MDQEKLEKSVKIAKNISIAVIFLVPFSYFCWFYLENQQPISLSSADWGAFGSFFGGVLSPVIALFAFYWLTQSILIQKKELSATQNVLVETEKVQKAQALTQEKKRFEDTFHSLLGQFNIVFESLNETIIIHNKPQASKIKKLYNRTMKIQVDPTREKDSLLANEDRIKERAALMREESIDCSHYFRILYHLLKFILLNHSLKTTPLNFNDAINTEITEVEKFYSNIVRSFLNKEVTQLLAINCIAADETDDYYKFRLLVERYALLEHIRLEQDWLKELFKYYKPSAFGNHPEAINKGNLTN